MSRQSDRPDPVVSREDRILGHPFDHLRGLPDGTLTRREVNILLDEILRLAAAADLTRLREREKELTEALTEIATADPVDLALDPTWAQRIAWAVLSSRTGSTEGDGT